ncbi:MAG: hypothetical protein FJ218_01400 [Ignavibacteria bacterium]|nr:hypothetical protein [Ignavibacteria bacterium]
MTSIRNILQILIDNNVEFVIIGGVAAIAVGSDYPTSDLDICYSRSIENLKKLSSVLLQLNSKLRHDPSDIPFIPDVPTLKAGLNFTFQTSLGALDLLGEVGGIGFYNDVKKYSIEAEAYGMNCNILNVDGLLLSKKFAGRKKDEAIIVVLEAIKELQEKRK